MKKHLKTAAVALVLAVSASTSFAQSVDLDTFAGTADGGIAMTLAVVTAEWAVATASSTNPENVALIAQSGDLGNIAYIDQSGGSGNFAAIMQEEVTGGLGNKAVIVQKGSSNRAVISQR